MPNILDGTKRALPGGFTAISAALTLERSQLPLPVIQAETYPTDKYDFPVVTIAFGRTDPERELAPVEANTADFYRGVDFVVPLLGDSLLGAAVFIPGQHEDYPTQTSQGFWYEERADCEVTRAGGQELCTTPGSWMGEPGRDKIASYYFQARTNEPPFFLDANMDAWTAAEIDLRLPKKGAFIALGHEAVQAVFDATTKQAEGSPELPPALLEMLSFVATKLEIEVPLLAKD